MLFIKQRTLLAGAAARRTCLLSLTATVTAAAAEAAHTTHTLARGHQARRHDATARGHEDNDLVSQGIAYASSPPRLVPPSVVRRSFASLRVRRRFVSPRIASQCFGFFSTQRFGERQCDGVAASLLLLPQSQSLPLAAVVTISGNSFSPACAVRVPSAHC